MGRYGSDPIALYHGLPIPELLEWIPAMDHLEAIEGLAMVDQVGLGSGTIEGNTADLVWSRLTAPIIQPKTKRTPRKKGESPF